MKWILSLLTLLFSTGSKAQVENTSYINASNERILQLSMIVPLETKEVWKYFSTDSKLSEWIAPVAHIELKNGGYLVTNYDKSKTLSDSSSIKLGIISYLENELLILKVDLNNHFSKKLQDEDQQLQEIIQLVPVAPGKTKIVSSMIGWGQGKDWEKTYNFFVKGNEWTYEQLLKIIK
ncbi:MAG: hypothetical protein EOO06_16440 [Chitinophagaceae bacterium]|nr:MAG: hypothetical protein EOO06_16440 [Chitinophagaceae bacterium]